MENQETIQKFVSGTRKKEMEEEKKILDEYMKEYSIPKSNYFLKRWVRKLDYSIRDEFINGEKYRVLYKAARKITKWNEEIDREFKKHIWDLIIHRIAKEEVFILEGNREGLPEDELTEGKITEHLFR